MSIRALECIDWVYELLQAQEAPEPLALRVTGLLARILRVGAPAGEQEAPRVARTFACAFSSSVKTEEKVMVMNIFIRVLQAQGIVPMRQPLPICYIKGFWPVASPRLPVGITLGYLFEQHVRVMSWDLGTGSGLRGLEWSPARLRGTLLWRAKLQQLFELLNESKPDLLCVQGVPLEIFTRLRQAFLPDYKMQRCNKQIVVCRKERFMWEHSSPSVYGLYNVQESSYQCTHSGWGIYLLDIHKRRCGEGDVITLCQYIERKVAARKAKEALVLTGNLSELRAYCEWVFPEEKSAYFSPDYRTVIEGDRATDGDAIWVLAEEGFGVSLLTVGDLPLFAQGAIRAICAAAAQKKIPNSPQDLQCSSYRETSVRT